MMQILRNRRASTAIMFAVFAAVLTLGLVTLTRQMQTVMVSHASNSGQHR